MSHHPSESLSEHVVHITEKHLTSDNDHSLDNADLSNGDSADGDGLHAELNEAESLEAEMLEQVDFNFPIKQLLLAMNRVVCQRLEVLETHVDNLGQLCVAMEDRVDTLSTAFKDYTAQNLPNAAAKRLGPTVIVGVPQPSSPLGPSADKNLVSSHLSTNVNSNITLITLNTEADYPNGSWLGDESNPEMRVRCHISPPDMLHINTTCHTAEKLALTLLDYLFDRETQACSNISGTGKHKKRQLDPLLVYGIRCHLISKFKITEKDWHRIKQNMDSKCRTAFRRKMKGMPLTTFREKNSSSIHGSVLDMDSHSEPLDDIHGLAIDQGSDTSQELDMAAHTLTLAPASINIGTQGDLTAMVQGAQVIHTPNGDIQVLHATPEQIAQIQQTHQIQILTGEQVIAAATTGHIIHEVDDDILCASVSDGES